jgi:hypothetical protein
MPADPATSILKAGFRTERPVALINPRVPWRLPAFSSQPSKRGRSNGPGNWSAPVFAAEKPKRW